VRIAIIGGGIGGLTTALALRQFGFEPKVFEQAPELLEVGAAIAMWPNAVRVLSKVGIGEKVLEHAGVIDQIRWQDHRGKLCNQIQLPIAEVPAVALHRADLQTVLLEALPRDSIHLNRDFTTFEHDQDSLRLNFTSHAAEYCDALIGADGLHSQVRDQLFGAGEPSYRGYFVWRGVTDCNPKNLDHAAAIEIHGRGQRFGIGPVGYGRIGWWASANEQLASTPDPETEQQTLLRLFDDWCEPVSELIAETELIIRNKVFDRPATRSWGLGPITLLGDAIHPTTPNLGQGGCMAVEDAAVLASCLARDGDASRAFRAYERSRYLRTSVLADCSRLYGSIGQWDSALGTSLRGAMISMLPQLITRRLLKLVFDYDALGTLTRI
jgi:2-polyprenyl-6-methoxyphenol hydroxylase-like FAD-dependent oxidoreductase